MLSADAQQKASLHHARMACAECSHTRALPESSDDDGVPHFSKELMHDLEVDAGILDTKLYKTRWGHQNSETEQEDQVINLRSGKNAQCKQGPLKFIAEFPIDSLHKIFRQLDPLDLLYLSWASKSLRGIVMEKSARYIWEEVGLILPKQRV
jgi:hypothetical protein